jgi:hypothetical protein
MGVKVMPAMASYITDVFGLPALAITKRTRRRATTHMNRKLRAVRGYLLGQSFLNGELSRESFQYAMLEGLYHEMLWHSRRDIGDHDDACFVLLHRLEKLAADHPVRSRLPGYREARQAVNSLAAHFAASKRVEAIETAIGAWIHDVKESRKVTQFTHRWASHARRWRWRVPLRPTPRVVTELVDEYRSMAAIFEILLCKTIGLVKVAEGESLDWRREHRQRLVKLERWAESPAAPPEIKLLSAGISREIRNVLAHGIPTFSGGRKRIEFYVGGRLTAEWTIGEFYTCTKRLTATVLAMLELEAQLQLVRFQTTLQNLAGAAIASQMRPAAAGVAAALTSSARNPRK